MDWLYRLALKIVPYSDIYQEGKLYLRTFFVWRPKWSERLFGIKTGGIYVHQFLRSDREPPHDHSWNYRTFVLRGGYVDEAWTLLGGHPWTRSDRILKPGMSVSRPAHHTHRVRLLDESKPAWTLMFVGTVKRDFYFYTDKGPVLWWKFLGYSSKPA